MSDPYFDTGKVTKVQIVQLKQPTSLTFTSQIAVDNIIQWRNQIATLRDGVLQIPSKNPLQVYKIDKLKCLSDEVLSQFWKIKISHRIFGDMFMGAPLRLGDQALPLQYCWFYKLVNQRILLMGVEIEKCQDIQGKQFKVPLDMVHTRGYIYKQSKFIKKWQIRYTVITQDGLFSFKNPGEDPSFSIRSDSVKYIWTRFDMHNCCLIVKVKHGLQKTQFAIPIMNYGRKVHNNWLLGFYKMMLHKDIIKMI